MGNPSGEEIASSVCQPTSDEANQEHNQKEWPRRYRIVSEMGEGEHGSLATDSSLPSVPILEETLEESSEELGFYCVSSAGEVYKLEYESLLRTDVRDRTCPPLGSPRE